MVDRSHVFNLLAKEKHLSGVALVATPTNTILMIAITFPIRPLPPSTSSGFVLLCGQSSKPRRQRKWFGEFEVLRVTPRHRYHHGSSLIRPFPFGKTPLTAFSKTARWKKRT